MDQFEKLVEYIINDEQGKAKELFHDIVVEKSRDIYESLIDETDLMDVDETEVSELADEIETDEAGISEEEDEAEMDADMEMDAEEEADAEEADVEERVEDLEDALDELKAEFDALMAGEAEEPEHADMEVPAEEEMPMAEATEEVDEDAEEIVREYKEKAPAPKTTEEGAQTASPVAANAGAKGAVAKPQASKGEESGAPTPKSNKMTDADTKAQPLKKV